MMKVINEEPQLVPLADKTLKEFNTYMKQWDGVTDIPEEFIWGSGPDAISSIGAGVSGKANFFEFMKDQKTKEIIKKLVDLRKNNSVNYKLIRPIHEAALLDYLDKYTFFKGSRPKISVCRLLTMLFPELFTTIANENHLKATAQALEIQSYKTLSFEHLQYLVWDKVQDILKSSKLQTSNLFMNGAVAYWIIDN